MCAQPKLTKHRSNALALIAEIANQESETPLSLSAVAQATGLSGAYLELLAADLRRGGLIRSFRGPHGGYILAKPAHEISIGDILDATKPVAAEKVVPKQPSTGQASTLWDKLEDFQSRLLHRISLADIIGGRLDAHPVLKGIRDICAHSPDNS